MSGRGRVIGLYERSGLLLGDWFWDLLVVGFIVVSEEVVEEDENDDEGAHTGTVQIQFVFHLCYYYTYIHGGINQSYHTTTN